MRVTFYTLNTLGDIVREGFTEAEMELETALSNLRGNSIKERGMGIEGFVVRDGAVEVFMLEKLIDTITDDVDMSTNESESNA